MKSRNIFNLLKNNKTKLFDNSKKVFSSQKPVDISKDKVLNDEMEKQNEKEYKQTINPDSKIFTNFNIKKNRDNQNEPGTQKKFSDIDRESESNMVAGQMQSSQADENLEEVKKNNFDKEKNK